MPSIALHIRHVCLCVCAASISIYLSIIHTIIPWPIRALLPSPTPLANWTFHCDNPHTDWKILYETKHSADSKHCQHADPSKAGRRTRKHRAMLTFFQFDTIASRNHTQGQVWVVGIERLNTSFSVFWTWMYRVGRLHTHQHTSKWPIGIFWNTPTLKGTNKELLFFCLKGTLNTVFPPLAIRSSFDDAF